MTHRCPLHRTLLFIASLLFASGSACARSQARAAGDENKATFSYSRNPSVVVLFVHEVAAQTGASHSMTLYGDGRLEVESRPRTLKPDRVRELQLSSQEVSELLRKAVDSGLADWDDLRIESQKLRRRGGSLFDTEDGTTVRVTLALESYRRGDWEEQNLTRKIVVRSPQILAEVFPDMPEFGGINWLVSYIFAALNGQVGNPS